MIKNAINDYKLILKHTNDLSGIFSLSDLKCLFNENNNVLLYRRIKTLEKHNILSRVIRGFYTAETFNKNALSARINRKSYISFGNILAKELIIGSVPFRNVAAIKLGRSRTYITDNINLEYFQIDPKLFFDFTTVNGISYATPEKALLDTLYYYQKGHNFSFDIYSDIDISRINKEKIVKMLQKYKNPKFISFVKGFLSNGN